MSCKSYNQLATNKSFDVLMHKTNQQLLKILSKQIFCNFIIKLDSLGSSNLLFPSTGAEERDLPPLPVPPEHTVGVQQLH